LPCGTKIQGEFASACGSVPQMTYGIFDEPVAASYDASSPEMFDDAVLVPTVDFLADLAGDGRALEFAIGTGRVGLALGARGVDVSGIELSQPMVDRMRAKEGGDEILVTIGDMATTVVSGKFRLVYLVYNTITNLLTQDEQVACFQNAAAHLEPGGTFVVEVFIPPLRRLPMGETFVAFDVSPGHVGIDEIDVANQTLVSKHFFISRGRGYTFDSPHRYAWPAEYDLMAKLAGLSLRERWSNWQREPFTSESTSHISVWEAPLAEVSI
jgi:SAM-dependent methyltransferase